MSRDLTIFDYFLSRSTVYPRYNIPHNETIEFLRGYAVCMPAFDMMISSW